MRHVVWPWPGPVGSTVRCVTVRPRSAALTSPTVASNGPIPLTASLAPTARTTIATTTPKRAVPCDLRGRRSPAGPAGCTPRTGRVDRGRRPQRTQGVGQRLGGRRRDGCRIGRTSAGLFHEARRAARAATSVRPPQRARRRPRSTAGPVRSRRQRQLAAQRSLAARGSRTHSVSATSSSAQPVALEPDEHQLLVAPPALRLQRLEVHRQVRLEVVVERSSRRRSGRPGGRRSASPRR